MVKYKEIKRRNTEIRYQDIKNLDIPSEYSRIRPEIKNNMNKKNVKKKMKQALRNPIVEGKLYIDDRTNCEASKT